MRRVETFNSGNWKRWLLLVTQLLVPLCSVAMAVPQKLSLPFEGEPRTYYILVPDGVSSAAPLILLLHGSGHDGMSQIDAWRKLAAKKKIILLAPNSKNSAEWSLVHDGPKFLHALLERVTATYPVDPRRVYIFGHSAGAMLALYMAILEPEYFAAAAIHAGTLRQDLGRYMEEGKRKIPIAIWAGTLDPYFPLAEVRSTRDQLKAHGFPVQLFEMRGHDHDYYSVTHEVNENAWRFLCGFQLTGPPRWDDRVVFSRTIWFSGPLPI